MTPILKNYLPEIKLAYVNPIPEKERLSVKSSKDTSTYFRAIWDNDTIELQEHFKVFYLRHNQIIGYYNLSSGKMNACYADTKLIFAAALKSAATQIIIAHNHPSGSLVPSKQDQVLTKQICEIAKLFDITVLDHIILTTESYFSFCDADML